MYKRQSTDSSLGAGASGLLHAWASEGLEMTQRADHSPSASMSAAPTRRMRDSREGNSLGAAPDIAAHAVIPQVVLGAGGGVRALGVDMSLSGTFLFGNQSGTVLYNFSQAVE